MEMIKCKTIKIKIRNVYGSDMVYPATHKQELYALTKTKTLTPVHVSALKDLGFTFEVITPDV